MTRIKNTVVALEKRKLVLSSDEGPSAEELKEGQHGLKRDDQPREVAEGIHT